MDISKVIELGLEWAEKRMASELTTMDKEYLLAGIKASLAKNCFQPEDIICLERAKKYARHQHFLGTQGKKLVEFDDWKSEGQLILSGVNISEAYVCPECNYPKFKKTFEDFERCEGCNWTSE